MAARRPWTPKGLYKSLTEFVEEKGLAPNSSVADVLTTLKEAIVEDALKSETPKQKPAAKSEATSEPAKS